MSLNSLKNKKFWRGVGIVLVGALVLGSWWFGWFQIVFYILGLYAAVYIVSYIFKTTGIITFLLSAGGLILYAVSAIVGLYFLYVILTIMFTESFLYGLLLLVLLSIFGSLLYFIPMAIGLVLGYPLMWMLEDIEKRFHAPEYRVLSQDQENTAESEIKKVN